MDPSLYVVTSGDVETSKAINTWTIGSGLPYQQAGNTWTGESSDVGFVSLSVGGDVNVFDKRKGDGPSKTLYVRGWRSTDPSGKPLTLVFLTHRDRKRV